MERKYRTKRVSRWMGKRYPNVPHISVGIIAAELGIGAPAARRMCVEHRIAGAVKVPPDMRPPSGAWIAPVPLRVNRAWKVHRGRPYRIKGGGDGYIGIPELARRMQISEQHARRMCQEGRFWGARRRFGAGWEIPSPPILDEKYAVLPN